MRGETPARQEELVDWETTSTVSCLSFLNIRKLAALLDGIWLVNSTNRLSKSDDVF